MVFETMNCKEAKRQIALWVGDDLDTVASLLLERHLSVCSPCRHYARQLKNDFRQLQQREAADELSRQESLWPELLRKLPAQPGRRAPQFNGWWAALAVGVAWFALVSFWQNESRRLRSAEDEGLQKISVSAPPRASFRNVSDSGRLPVTPVGTPVGQPVRQSPPLLPDVPSLDLEILPNADLPSVSVRSGEDRGEAVLSIFGRPPASSRTSAVPVKQPYAIPWKTSSGE